MVDWLKECYASRWYLFRDDLTTYTAGYYYFAPPGTPHYPGFHHLGSRRWLNGNNGLIQSLGEDLHYRQSHRTGVFAGEVPNARLVGSADCIEHGEDLDDAADVADLFHGYPLQCWLPSQPPEQPQPRNYERASAWDRCAVAALWAKVLEYSYANAGSSIVLMLTEFLQSMQTIKWHPAARDYPAITTVKGDIPAGEPYALVALDGTRNFQQLAMQALYSRNGPTDVGILGTNPFWYDAADFVHRQLLKDGINDLRPIFFTGHSYGAVVALILAARYKAAHPNRTIRYLTFGCPKIGDARLRNLVASCEGASLRNDNDVITTIPPDPETLAPVEVFFPQVATWLFEKWERPPTALTQDEAGKLVAGGDFELGFDVAFDLIARAALGQPFARVAGHGISEYIRRIRLRCPDVDWPINDEVDVDIDVDVSMGMAILELSGGPPRAEFLPWQLASPQSLLATARGAVGFPLVYTGAAQGVSGPGPGLAIFDTAGAFTWTAPTGITSVTVVAIGSGGTGGASPGIGWGGGGGAGGGGTASALCPVTPGTTYNGNVGTAGGSPTDARSEFAADSAALVQAEAGGDGGNGSVGAAGTGSAGGGTTVSGGASSIFEGVGGAGGDGAGPGPFGGGGGGSSAGFAAAGNDGSTGGLGGAPGGARVFGGGPGGFGANNFNAAPAVFPFGGGGGGSGCSSNTHQVGADGLVILAWARGAAAPAAGSILAETGDHILLESGDRILLE